MFFDPAVPPHLHGEAADHSGGGPRFPPWFAVQTAPLAALTVRYGAPATDRFSTAMPCFHILNGFARKKPSFLSASCLIGRVPKSRGPRGRSCSLIRSSDSATGGLDRPAWYGGDSSFFDSDAVFSYT
jgi:hypothetical protein